MREETHATMRPPGTRSLGIRPLGRALHRRRCAGGATDGGFSLAEVLVSLFVFALVSVGVLHTLISVITVNRDSRARQVAANLAAAQIDRAREEADVFQLLDEARTIQVGTETYRVNQTAAWVSDPSADFDCGSGSSSLRYKRVNVTVTWDGMRASTEPVRSDSLIDPKERINDPSKGTLLVSVLNASGAGTAGVSVVAQPVDASGNPVGSPLPTATTDAQGCAYILRVAPTNYRISISKAGHVNTAGVANPSTTIGVAAGSAGSAAFEYDAAATVTVRYGTNSPVSGVVVPDTSMNTTLANTTAYSATPGTVVVGGVSGSPARRFTVYPFASGFDVFAGTESNSEVAANTCRSVDPGAWPGGTRQASVAATPGSSASVDVPMGVVSIDVGSVGSSVRFLRAQMVSPPSGVDDPGCQTGQAYTFGSVLSGSGQATIALPYGTWQLYRGSSTSQTTTVTASQITPRADAAANGSVVGVVLGDKVVMDPRITP